VADAGYLTAEESASLDRLVSDLEARTGTQIVPAVVGKSDSYVELPWTAFALGASLASLGVVLADAWRPQWSVSATAILHVGVVLGAAAACALLAIFAPPFARLFLRPARGQIEVRQYAESLFLRRGLFATRRRTAVLILISLFERRIEIVADTGFRDRVTDAEWQAVIATMSSHLRDRRPGDALREALAACAALLEAKGFAAVEGDLDVFPNRPIEERGE
jgi:putative membrane protein